MPNYLEYQKSVAAEFRALENRVRNLIDNSHWGEEGRFKEVILVNYLKKILPKHLSVGTGFIRNQDRITNQIDIIIYDNTFPLLFSEGDFIISTAENVVAIIEVKSNIESSKLCGIIHKANENAEVIVGDTDKSIFNGIFTYNVTGGSERYIDKLMDYDYSNLINKKVFNEPISRGLYSCVNHIALGSDLFVRLWPLGQDEENKADYLSDFPEPYYSIYHMDDGLAYSYFFSNLQEHLIRLATGNLRANLPNEMKVFLFPIINGKETGLLERVYLNYFQRDVKRKQRFDVLNEFFCSSTDFHITLSFNQVEEMIGHELSPSAYMYPSKACPIMNAWINNGYKLDKVNKRARQFSFTKQ